MSKTAIVIGSTGVVGSALIKQLLDDSQYESIVTFSRRPLKSSDDSALTHHKLTQHIINFNQPITWQEKLRGDDLFCCIGTTLKKAKSKTRQQEIDLELPIEFAKIAKQQDIQQMILVSSTGANKRSKSFYLRLKGQLEESIKQLNFRRLIVVRPSVLVGQRNDFRLGEKLSIILLSALSWLPVIKKYRPITGEQVASTMRTLANKELTPDNTMVVKEVVIKELNELFL